MSGSAPPQRSPPKFRSVRERQFGERREARLVDRGPVLEGGAGCHHLECRPGEVALAVGAGQERLVGVGVQAVPRGAHRGLIVHGERRGVVGGIAPQCQQRAGARIERHDRPLAPPEGVGRHLLDALRDGESDVPCALLAEQHVSDAVEAEPGGAPGELVVVDALDAVGAEREREVAGDLREKVALGVRPHPLEGVVGRVGSGQHLAVGALDDAARLAEVAHDLARVARVVVEASGGEDLPVTQPHDEAQHHRGQQDAEPADLGVH